MNPLRVQLQSVDDWLLEYTTGKLVEPSGQKSQPMYKYWMHEPSRAEPDNVKPTTPILVYDTHRTTKNGSLILVFIVQETGEEAIAFFNVDIRRQRGAEKGLSYRAGHRGQFLPPPRGTCRKFWMSVVGTPPPRWSLMYKFLKPRLKGLQFTGTLTTEISNNKPYIKITAIRKIGTDDQHFRNSLGTI